MKFYIYFFGSIFSCRDCGDHFKLEEKIFPRIDIQTNEDGVMWLWKIHNKVNSRLENAVSRARISIFFNYIEKKYRSHSA